MFVLGGGVDNTSSPFYRQSILTPNFASRSSGPFFLSSSLQLITCFLVFISEPTFMQQKFAYDVGLVSTYSAHYYSIFLGVSSCCNGLSDGLRNRRTRVRTPVTLLRSLSGKYPWERYEPPYPPSYGLNSTTTVLLGEWLWH